MTKERVIKPKLERFEFKPVKELRVSLEDNPKLREASSLYSLVL